MLLVQALDAEAFAPYGWMLGQPFPGADANAAFRNAAADFWHAHAFEVGEGGQPELLWVAYRDDASPLSALETHLLTQQALMPLTGALIQFVACSGADGAPDMATLRGFRVTPGQGICMRPGCWHTTRSTGGEVLGAMLTRRSTTVDLARHLAHGEPARESTIVQIAPQTWQVPE